MAIHEFVGINDDNRAAIKRLKPIILRPIFNKQTGELAGHIAFTRIDDAIDHWSGVRIASTGNKGKAA